MIVFCQEKGQVKYYLDIRSQLLKKCELIWAEFTEKKENCGTVKNEIEEFSKLNSGKISLLNSELIKAEFMNPIYFEEKDYLSNIKLIAEQWYNIEKELHNPEFWYFIPKDYKRKDSEADVYSTRIDEIFNYTLIKLYRDNDKNKNAHSFFYEHKKQIELDSYFLYNQYNKWLSEKYKKNEEPKKYLYHEKLE